MWLFKKRNKNALNNIETLNVLKQQIIEKAKMKMYVNYLSPEQIEKLLSNNKDIDFIDDEIKEEMNFPDIEYLTAKLMPPIKENLIKKNILPEELIKATALGDIIGSKYEFTEHNYNEAKIEELPPRNSHITDDTVLSIATMKAIAKNNKNPNFTREYVIAYGKYPTAGYGGGFTGWAVNALELMKNNKENEIKGYHSFGNGCGMRVSFIPAFYEDIQDVIEHTISATMATHDHIEAIKATVIISVCIWMALHNYTKDEIYNYCKSHYEYDEETKDLLIHKWSLFDMNAELSSLPNDKSKQSLYSNYAIPYAVKCFYETNSYDGCMREILSHFGDTDTVCAIAGGLCYAYYGETNLCMNQILEEKGVIKMLQIDQ